MKRRKQTQDQATRVAHEQKEQARETAAHTEAEVQVADDRNTPIPAIASPGGAVWCPRCEVFWSMWSERYADGRHATCGQAFAIDVSQLTVETQGLVIARLMRNIQ